MRDDGVGIGELGREVDVAARPALAVADAALVEAQRVVAGACPRARERRERSGLDRLARDAADQHDQRARRTRERRERAQPNPRWLRDRFAGRRDSQLAVRDVCVARCADHRHADLEPVARAVDDQLDRIVCAAPRSACPSSQRSATRRPAIADHSITGLQPRSLGHAAGDHTGDDHRTALECFDIRR